MSQAKQDTVTVKGAWLKACGRGEADRAFPVIRVNQTCSPKGSGFDVMYDINYEGSIWVVAQCRLVGEA